MAAEDKTPANFCKNPSNISALKCTDADILRFSRLLSKNMKGIEKGKSNEIAGLYGSIWLTLITLLLVETRNVICGLNCSINLVAKPSFLNFVNLPSWPVFNFQNLKKKV